MCFEDIALEDLRSLVFEKTSSASISQEIEMTLVGRSASWPFSVKPIDPSRPKQPFKRVFQLTSLDDIISRELAELDAALHDCDCDVTKQYLELAKKSNLSRFEERCNTPSPAESSDSSENELTKSQTTLPSEQCATMPSSAECNADETTESKTTFFYQASDGRALFMHSINFRCLVSMYGNPQKFPHSVKAKVLEMNEYQQTEVRASMGLFTLSSIISFSH